MPPTLYVTKPAKVVETPNLTINEFFGNVASKDATTSFALVEVAAADDLGASIDEQFQRRQRLRQPRRVRDFWRAVALGEWQVQVSAHKHDLTLEADSLAELSQRVLLGRCRRQVAARQRERARASRAHPA